MNSIYSDRLLQEIHEFKRQWFMEDYQQDEIYRKYHIVHRRDRNFGERISMAFREGYQLTDRDLFLEFGNFFVELSEMEPSYANRHSLQREQYYFKSITNLKHTRQEEGVQGFSGLAAKVIKENEVVQLMNLIQIQSAAIAVNAQSILRELHIFEKKFLWQAGRRKVVLTSRVQVMFKIMQVIINVFQSTNELNSEKIVSGKIKLFNSFLKYFLSQLLGRKLTNCPLRDKSLLLRGVILQEIGKIQRHVLMFQDTETQLFDLMSNSVKLYGIYNQGKLLGFIGKNDHNILKLPYLELIYSMLQNYGQAKLGARDIFHRILTRIYNCLFQKKQRGLRDSYKQGKLMSDIIIKVSSFYPFDFTKEINKLFQRLHNQFQFNFLTSLLLIYKSKMSRQVLDKITPENQRAYFQNKYDGPYEGLLTQFSQYQMNIIDYVSDPEETQKLLWHLLTIRNSVIINFQYLQQNQFIHGIYLNMIKLVLCNIYAEQCVQICHKIFEHQLELARQDLKRLCISQLIGDLQRWQGFQPTKQSLGCFRDIVNLHTKFAPLQTIQSMELLCNVSNMIVSVLGRGQNSRQFINIAVDLLRLSLPQSLNTISLQNIKNGYVALVRVVQAHFCIEFFDVYLDLMHMSIQNPYLVQLFLTDNKIPGKLFNKQIARVLSHQIDKYQILGYIINKGGFNQTAVQKSWQIVQSLIPIHERDLCVHVIELFTYFGNQLNRARLQDAYRTVYGQYLEKQVSKTSAVLLQIAKQLEQTVIVQDLIALLQMQVAFHAYLFELLTDLEKDHSRNYPRQINSIVKYVHSGLKLLEESKWFTSWKEVGKSELKKHWAVCYLTLLTLVCISNRMNKRTVHQNLDHLQPTVIDKLSYVKRIMEPLESEDNEIFIHYRRVIPLECQKILRNPWKYKADRLE